MSGEQLNSALTEIVDWALTEIVRLRAEIELARKRAHTCPHSNCDAQRWRDALMRIERVVDKVPEVSRHNAVWATVLKIARDALAGDQ